MTPSGLSPGGRPIARVRPATAADLDGICDVERRAFGSDVEPELVRTLLADPWAFIEGLCLVAEDDEGPVGHVLFTRAGVGQGVSAVLLAPLAVAPERQRQGVGTLLVREGLSRARAGGFEVALVLGDPDYYSRFGFAPALPHGIVPPFPVEPHEAWMTVELVSGSLTRAAGPVALADAFYDPALWRE